MKHALTKDLKPGDVISQMPGSRKITVEQVSHDDKHEDERVRHYGSVVGIDEEGTTHAIRTFGAVYLHEAGDGDSDAAE